MALADSMTDVIRLEAGEPSFNTPSHIIEAALADAHLGFTKYTPVAGLRSLREAIAERHSSELGRDVVPEDVFVSTGAVGALASAVLALAEEGDEVLVPDPGWPNYETMVQLSRATAVTYPIRPESGYVLDVRDIAKVISSRTKAVILNSPSNPCGSVIDPEQLQLITNLATKHDFYLIVDEVYGDLVFEGEFVSAARYDREGRTVVVTGCSKTYAMTGWRIGWAVARPDLVALMIKLQEPLTSCPSTISQRAAEAALRGPQAVVAEMRLAYRRRRDLVCEILEPAGILAARPRGGFYALVDLRTTEMPSLELAQRLLIEEKVATVPGSAFGKFGEGMLRISLASDDEVLMEGCRRIVRFARDSARRSLAG